MDSGVVEDILLVPVGISYDMLIERNFVRHELMVRGGWKLWAWELNYVF